MKKETVVDALLDAKDILGKVYGECLAENAHPSITNKLTTIDLLIVELLEAIEK